MSNELFKLATDSETMKDLFGKLVGANIWAHDKVSGDVFLSRNDYMLLDIRNEFQKRKKEPPILRVVPYGSKVSYLVRLEGEEDPNKLDLR